MRRLLAQGLLVCGTEHQESAGGVSVGPKTKLLGCMLREHEGL